jgi:HSP20 family protein
MAHQAASFQKGGRIMPELSRWEPFRTHWNPWKELQEMEKRLSTMWGRPPAKDEGGKEAMTVAEWAPLVDISEDDKEYLIKAELPDVKKENVKISIQDDVVSISGERKYEKEEKGKKYHRVERSYGTFMRSFMLPEDADGSKITAEYKDGVLQVHLPKSEKAKPKTIDVKVS